MSKAPHTPDEESHGPRTQRLEVRSTASQKRMIEEAAQFLGETVSSFVLSTAVSRAAEVIGSQRVIDLSRRDWEAFNALIEKDAGPNQKLQAASERYRKLVKSDER